MSILLVIGCIVLYFVIGIILSALFGIVSSKTLVVCEQGLIAIFWPAVTFMVIVAYSIVIPGMIASKIVKYWKNND